MTSKFKFPLARAMYFTWGSIEPTNKVALDHAGFATREDALSFYKEHRTAIIKHFKKNKHWTPAPWDAML